MFSAKGRRRLLTWTLVVGALTLVAASTLVVTGRPQFCRSCHLMETRYVAWERSVHADKATCLDCHASPGFVGEVQAHLNGARYLVALATGRPQVILRAEIPQGTCVECHRPGELSTTSDGVPIAHIAHFEADVRCQECHNGFHDDLGGGELKADLSTCDNCHPASIRVLSQQR
jgi:nitrate/TMAO reductase-like tetraheme cytochrome c subunit